MAVVLPGLRLRRRAAKISQEDLGAAVGCSGAAVGMWERGETAPETAKLPELARVLGCSIDDLFAEEDRGIEAPAD